LWVAFYIGSIIFIPRMESIVLSPLSPEMESIVLDPEIRWYVFPYMITVIVGFGFLVYKTVDSATNE